MVVSASALACCPSKRGRVSVLVMLVSVKMSCKMRYCSGSGDMPISISCCLLGSWRTMGSRSNWVVNRSVVLAHLKNDELFFKDFAIMVNDSTIYFNNRGAIYHLDLRPEEIADTVITVGDPDRVHEVSKHFDSIEIKRQHREFITHTGKVGNKRLTVLSSGIGPDNIDIVINELDALVNIDFKTREIKKELKSINIIRIGTSGSLQADIPVDHFVASTHGLGVDNLLNFYRLEQNDEEQLLIQSFITHTQVHGQIGNPYISSGAASIWRLVLSR